LHIIMYNMHTPVGNDKRLLVDLIRNIHETFGALRRAPLAPFDKLRAGRTGKEESFR